MLDILLRARPDERFHLQIGQPISVVWEWGPFRRTTWTNIFLPDGTPGAFVSWWFWKLQIYHGTTKCDASRTIWYWNEQLDDGNQLPYAADPSRYVMTTTPKEMLAVRWRAGGRQPVEWNNMGGS